MERLEPARMKVPCPASAARPLEILLPTSTGDVAMKRSISELFDFNLIKLNLNLTSIKLKLI